MEIETHAALSSFDLNKQAPTFSHFSDHPGPRVSSPFRDSLLSNEHDYDGAPPSLPVECDSNNHKACSTDQMASAPSSESVGVDVPLSSTQNAAMKMQKVYRSYRTRRMLADSAVVAEELWWQAIDFARLNHSTISFFNYLKPESPVSRWNRIRQNASKVGKGLSKDDKAQKLAFQHWIEAVDPRHRYGHNLHIYYEEWCKADAGQPFFYWLDLGDGKEVDLKKCPRSKLRRQCIKYLGPQEREHYEYVAMEGKFIHKQTGDLLDTTKGLPGAKWIFVMSTAKRLYAGEKKKGMFHHSSFLAGGATLAAGRLVVENGVLKSISPYSGHYRPTDDSFKNFLWFLEENGVNLDEVEIKKANEDYETYDDGTSSSLTKSDASEVSRATSSLRISLPNEVNGDLPSGGLKVQSESLYRRTLSGGLQSPKTEVSETAILQRINSKKAARSYQLGNQLSLKWSTGAGPRIGCVADYPVELRVQALELTNLSPRACGNPMCALPTKNAVLVSPTHFQSIDLNNGGLSSP